MYGAKLMKRFLIILLLLFTPTLIHAELVYLWIKKSDDIGFTKGDIIAITPATAQYEPTPSELVNVFVVKVDLTNDEKNNLMQQNTKEETIDFEGEKIPETVVVHERKNKLDIDSLNIKTPKEERTKNEIISKVIDKSVAVVNP